MLRRPPAAPVLLCLLAATLLLAGGSAARSFGAPRNVVAPKITGEAKVGSRLTASHGRWAGHPRSFRYAWQRCNKGRKCTKVERASKPTYIVNSTDVGHRLRVVVVAANGDGMAQARSLWSKPVKKRGRGQPPPPPAPPAPPAPPPPPGEQRLSEWARLGSNQGPPACEAGALPLSYAPGREQA